MQFALSHRGPDFAGEWRDGNLTLGHRLLAVRDAAEASRQPVKKSESPWVLAFNGQLYNMRHMRAELGPAFASTELDTTLLYGLIEKHGWDFVRHIEGMYAIALYNEREKVLKLYRDPAGQKPMYFSTKDGRIAFSSEIRGLAALGIPTDRPDDVGLACARAIGYIPGRKTLIQGISKLGPGDILTVRLPGGETAWETIPHGRERVFEGEPAGVMRELITEHLASKQKVSLNLSGGLDSSLILHEAHAAGHALHTYTTFFESSDERTNEDALIARKLAKDYGTDHTEIVVTRDSFLELFEDAYRLIEEPNYNISLPVYLATARREGVHGDGNRVVLSGDGGDELFGGYPFYQEGLKYAALFSRYPQWLVQGYKRAREGLWWRFDDPVSIWLHSKLFPDGTPSEVRERRDTTLAYLRESLPASYAARKKDPIRDLMLLDRAFWLAGENFIRTDKLYMSESMEMRAPLAYEPLRAYFDARLSDSDYRADGSNKAFLRELYDGKLPDYVTKRSAKTGWRAPAGAWWGEEMRARYLGILDGAKRGGAIDWTALRDRVASAESWPGKRMHLYLSLAILSRTYGLPL